MFIYTYIYMNHCEFTNTYLLALFFILNVYIFEGHKLKKAAKLLGRHFACGAAVSKTDTGGKQIVIQGDCQFEVPAILQEKFEVESFLNHRLRFDFVFFVIFVVIFLKNILVKVPPEAMFFVEIKKGKKQKDEVPAHYFA